MGDDEFGARNGKIMQGIYDPNTDNGENVEKVSHSEQEKIAVEDSDDIQGSLHWCVWGPNWPIEFGWSALNGMYFHFRVFSILTMNVDSTCLDIPTTNVTLYVYFRFRDVCDISFISKELIGSKHKITKIFSPATISGLR